MSMVVETLAALAACCCCCCLAAAALAALLPPPTRLPPVSSEVSPRSLARAASAVPYRASTLARALAASSALFLARRSSMLRATRRASLSVSCTTFESPVSRTRSRAAFWLSARSGAALTSSAADSRISERSVPSLALASAEAGCLA